jgi:hypothetical protein
MRAFRQLRVQGQAAQRIAQLARTGVHMSDPYRAFLKKLLWVAIIYLGLMAELGFLRGSGVL